LGVNTLTSGLFAEKKVANASASCCFDGVNRSILVGVIP